MSRQNVVILGTLKVGEDDLISLRDCLTRAALDSRQIPGCLHYAVSVDISDHLQIHLAEVWETSAHFDARLASPAFARTRDHIAALKSVVPRLTKYNVTQT